jgi:hypothetical protein
MQTDDGSINKESAGKTTLDERRDNLMAKKNKNKQPQVDANLQKLDVEFSEEGVAQVQSQPAEKAARQKNKK